MRNLSWREKTAQLATILGSTRLIAILYASVETLRSLVLAAVFTVTFSRQVFVPVTLARDCQ